MWLERKNKTPQKLRFHSANKIDNYNEGLRWGGKEKKKKKKKSKRNYKTSQNTRIINVFLESLLSALSLAGSHSPPHLPRMPSNTVLVSGPALGAAQTLIWSCSCVFLPPMFTASDLVHFLLWELSMAFYIFHRHTVCLVDHADLICSLYSW